MPFWHLFPLDVTSDHWRASTYKGDVIVRATSEAEARSTATTTFFRAYERVPGGIILFSPWNQPTVVACQRVEGLPLQRRLIHLPVFLLLFVGCSRPHAKYCQ